MKDGEDVELLHEHIPRLIELHNNIALTNNGVDEFSLNRRVQIGLWIRKMKSLWKLGRA